MGFRALYCRSILSLDCADQDWTAPVVDTGSAFVEWWATFDCAPDDYERLIQQFEHAGFEVWLNELRKSMETRP